MSLTKGFLVSQPHVIERESPADAPADQAYFSPSYRIFNTQTDAVQQVGLNMLADGSYPLQLEPCGGAGCDVPGGGWRFEVCQNHKGHALHNL